MLQVKKRLPWFLKALPSEDCAKGGAGAYTDALQRSSKESTGIKVLAHHRPVLFSDSPAACSCHAGSYSCNFCVRWLQHASY